MPLPQQIESETPWLGRSSCCKMLCALRRSLSLPLLPRRVWNRTAGVATWKLVNRKGRGMLGTEEWWKNRLLQKWPLVLSNSSCRRVHVFFVIGYSIRFLQACFTISSILQCNV